MKPLLTLTLFLYALILSAQKLTRGTYLQAASPNQITFRWRTDTACIGTVRYGTAFNALSKIASETRATKEHIVTIGGLTPETKHFYSIFGGANMLITNSEDNHFYTFPTEGSKKKRRIWVLGDEGSGNDDARTVAKAFEGYLKQNNIPYLDLWLTLGDNAYTDGRDEEFQTNFFDIYKNTKIIRQSPLFPCLGNHEYCNTNEKCQDTHEIAYKDIFTLPSKGEAGGKASNKWEYYSYNCGNAHFVCLDSYGEENDKRFWLDEAQRRWMEQDLKQANANPNIKWVILYWHHPPYSVSSHNSDLEWDLQALRENLIPIVEKYKVDLVLNGHSHAYERSRLMRGHTGDQTTFDFVKHLSPAKNNGNSSGLYDNSLQSCPYIKNSKSIDNEGIVYVVNGSGSVAYNQNPDFPHKSMRAYLPTATKASFNNSNPGSMLIEIEDNRLDAKFIDKNGAVTDQFTMMKDVIRRDTLNVKTGQSITLKPSWIGSYRWDNTALTPTINVSPAVNTMYTVRDAERCIRDTFEVRINATAVTDITRKFIISPNPTMGTVFLEDIDFQNNKQVEIFNVIGQKVKEILILGEAMVLDMSDLHQGIYFLKIGFLMQKIIKN
jgi:acid phosphatase type 7